MKNPLEQSYEYIKEDNQYRKYGLLKLNENRKLIKPFPSTFPNYIYDIRCGYIILDEEISTAVLEKLFFINLKTEYIKEFSVRPDLEKKVQLKDRHFIRDEKEFGKYFSFPNLKESFPTKLYSTDMKDILFIKIENNNITFEEILEDFSIEENNIKTQVVHCEYFEENNKYFISHLDHEYIFYSLEEYENKKQNIRQKGTAMKRKKTFKIDNSKIPFIFDMEEGINKQRINILLFILIECFKNKDLINEYFQNI